MQVAGRNCCTFRCLYPESVPKHGLREVVATFVNRSSRPSVLSYQSISYSICLYSGPLLLIYSYFQFLYIFLKRFRGLKFDCFQLLNFIPIKCCGMRRASVPCAITLQNRIGPLCFGTRLWLSTIFREQCLTRSLAWIAEHI